MATVQIFDPAMCCSTGVCGTEVDPALSRFAADVEWLVARGVRVDRATLSQEPGKFVENVPVREALQRGGTAALPAVVVEGELRCTGDYPSREQLAAWAGVVLTDGPAVAREPVAAAGTGRVELPLAGGCCGGGGSC